MNSTASMLRNGAIGTFCLAGSRHSEILYVVIVKLLQLMKKAFKKVTKKKGIKAKFNDNLTKKQFYAHGAQDRNWFLDMVSFINKGSPSKGYLKRMKRHWEHFDNP